MDEEMFLRLLDRYRNDQRFHFLVTIFSTDIATWTPTPDELFEAYAFAKARMNAFEPSTGLVES
jgi:hypothetical protein